MFSSFLPNIYSTAGTCVSVIAVILLQSILETFSGASKSAVQLSGVVLVGLLLLGPTGNLIQVGVDTVCQLSDYNKLLIPVLTGALAAQGNVSSSTALYAITSFFSTFLTTLITKIAVPMLYILLCLGLVDGIFKNELITKLKDLIKWLITWSLKLSLYIFTGFITITGVVSGTTDASAVKALKLSIAGMVPVVGGIISDASETILLSAQVMKSAAGIYGIYALLAIFVGPFLQIGVQYILLNVTGAVCSAFSSKEGKDLLKNYASGMGLLLAMTGTVCLIFLIGVVCFMKGVS